MRVTLAFAAGGSHPVDLSGILPAGVLGLSRAGIERLPVVVSGRQVNLGDTCRVKCLARGKDSLVLQGETGSLERVGWQMTAGTMVIEGDAGYGTGEGMRAGVIEIQGNAADCLGLAMQGGVIRLHGRAGDWCGADHPGGMGGMSGGILLVGGDVGREAGAGMRRGLILVSGSTGEYCAAHMQAGTVLCAGSLGKYAGIGMRRGSIVAGKAAPLLPGFRFARQADTGWLRICFTMLEKMGVRFPEEWSKGAPQRYTGDHLAIGKGELLVYDEPE